MATSTKNSFQRIASASGWLFFDRLLRLVFGLLVGILVARHYGPSQWGALSFVMASSILFGSIASAGSENIIMRDLSQGHAQVSEGDIQRTALILRIFFGSLAYIFLLVFIFATHGMGLLVYLASAYGLIFIFQVSDIWEYWLRMEHNLPAVAKTHVLSSILSNLLKLMSIIFGLPIICIALSMAAEYASNLGILYKFRSRDWPGWLGSFRPEYAKTLLKSSLIVMLSSFLIASQSRTEYYLISHYLNLESVGLYAAAFKCMEIVDVMVLIFTMTLVPELYKRDHFELPVLASRIYLLGFIFFVISLLLMAAVYILFPWIYGPNYLAAQELIPWLALRPLFIILGAIRGMFLVMERRLSYVPICAGIGLVACVIAGSFLIPIWGLKGAAISGLIGLTISNFVIDIFFQPRKIGQMFFCYRQFPYLLQRGLEVLKNRRFQP